MSGPNERDRRPYVTADRDALSADSRTPAVVLVLGMFFALVGLSASVVFYIGQSRGFW